MLGRISNPTEPESVGLVILPGMDILCQIQIQMQGATYTKSTLDPRLFISDDTPNGWCAYLLRMSESYEESQIDFKTIWDGTGSRNYIKYRGEFLFSRKQPKDAGEHYNQKIRAVLNNKINVPYSICLVWILEPDAEPTNENIFIIPLWEQATKQYQIAMDTSFSFGNGIGEITPKKAVAAKREIIGDYSAIQLPTGTMQGLTNRPHPMHFGLKLKNGEMPSTRHTNQIIKDSYITIPVSGKASGCIRFGMSFLEKEDLLGFDFGLKYFYENGSFTEFEYPILKSGREHYEVFCQASIDPANLLNQPVEEGITRPIRTYFAFTGKTNFKLQSGEPHEDTVFDTFFKTETGYGLKMKPFVKDSNPDIEDNNYFAGENCARLVFTQKNTGGNDFYFAPAGDFQLEYDTEGLPDDLADDRTQLLTGLSGTESIGFQPKKDFEQRDGTVTPKADKIRFRPYQNAFAPYFPIERASAGGEIICDPTLTEKSQTSWVNIVGKTGKPVIYYAQSEGGSLYAKTGVDGEFLDFFEPGVELPQDGDFSVPLVPYRGVQTAEKQADFESQILSPIRKRNIADENPNHKVESPEDYVSVTTPQGLIVAIDNVENEGEWKEVIFAENTESAIDTGLNNYFNFEKVDAEPEPESPDDENQNMLPEFKFGFINLGKELQEVFQSNQQFLVATNADKLGELVSKLSDAELSKEGPLTSGDAIFNNRMYINDWPFDVNTGDNGVIEYDENEVATSGDFRNVLIVKFCKGTLRERIKNPSLWTDSCDFNEVKNLNAIAAWLQKYMDEAEKQDNKYYEYFNRIVDDENWNGVLALKLDLDAGAFPENLKGLLGGMDLNRLFIHHFGIEINHIDTTDELQISENSSLFGLIDYKDALYNPDNPNAPVVADTSPHDFKVTTLQVLFENSDIKDFACKVQVTLDELFKEAVSEVRIPDLNLAATDSNSVVLNGTYEEHDGKSVYTFVSTSDTFFDLESHVIHFVEIERAIFETLSDTGGHIKSRFSFWGNLNFEILKEGDQQTDLLSFGWEPEAESGRGLTFNNLQLTMDFDLPTDDEDGVQNRTFGLITDFFEPFLQDSYSRETGLYSKFPLDFQGFVFGSNTQSPSDLGYLTINVKGEFAPPDGEEVGETWGVSTESLTSEWYGLKYKMNLGTPGELASAAGYEVDFIIAWSPQNAGDSTPRVFLGMTLPGPGGASKIMNLQDIINFSVGDLELDFHENSGAFELRFRDVGFKFFNILKLPGVFEEYPFAQANFSLFANANSTDSKNLGWFLSYAESVNPRLINVLFLALGQHVELTNYQEIETMEDAIEAMKSAFITYRTGNFSKLLEGTEPNLPNGAVGLDFNEESNWLIAFHLGMLSQDFFDPNLYAIETSVIFNDPNIYGLRIIAQGDTVSFFDGLEFEIMYRKLEEGLGVYRGELTLPAKLRSFKLGPATITLATIAVEVYTNGDFLVDLGFPHERDFSRSFDVEVQVGYVPVVGALGFYFGKLSGNTARNMPAIYNDPSTGEPLGKFDPIMVFGLGMEIGVGKSYVEGPLSASIRVTLVGILEGIVATWLPAEQPQNTTGNLDDGTYYWIQGTIGIVGMLEGKVDFKVIKAGVEVELYALVSAIFESYKEIPITLSAGVEVKVTVEVDMGLFTIEEDFSFSEHIEEEFTIGENKLNSAPWRAGGTPALMAMSSRALPADDDSISLKTLSSTTKAPLNLYFNLANTVSDEPSGGEAACVATLMMRSPDVQDTSMGETDFDNLAEQVFRWMVIDADSEYASDNGFDDQILNYEDLKDFKECHLANPDILRPITKDEIYTFLTNNFNLNIKTGDSESFIEKDKDGNVTNEYKATVFPMIPTYTLEIAFDDTVKKSVTFDAFSRASEKYLVEELPAFFGDLSYQNSGSGSIDYEKDAVRSLAEDNFEDYFTMIARHMVSSALQSFKKYNYPIASGDSLTSIAAYFSGRGNEVTIEKIAVENRFHKITGDSTLHDRAISEGKTVEELALELANEVDLFDTSEDAHLSIPNLTNLSIGEILDDLFLRNATANLSGMTMRYQLHGLRLPKTSELTLTQGTFKDGEDYGFYKLTGQQFLLPKVLPNRDKTEHKDLNINLIYGSEDTDKVTITYDNAYVTSKNSLLNLALSDVDFGDVLNSKNQYKEVAHQFKFKSHLHWGGDLIWNFSDNLLNQIHTDLGQTPKIFRDYAVKIATENAAKRTMEYSAPSTQNWGTKIDLTIRKYPDEDGTFRYELIGTDEFGIVFLERMLEDGQASLLTESQFRILYSALDGDENLIKNSLQSKDISSVTTFINQANLSTETNPPNLGEAMARSVNPDEDVPVNILNGPLEFLKFIWQCSITRTGGYYLYYEETGGTTFPSQIFGEDNTAIIQLLIQHDVGNQLTNYMNCVVTDSEMDLKDSSVYAETESLKDKCALLPQGVLAYEIQRTKPEEYIDPTTGTVSDYTKYLESLYHLMSYRILDGSGTALTKFSLPIGPTEILDQAEATNKFRPPNTDDGIWNYKLSIPFYKYATAPAMSAPFDSVENIYAGIGTSAQIEVCWKDLFGNCAFDFAQKSADNNSNLLTIGYTDKLLSVNQWPNVEFFYDIDGGNLNLHYIYNVPEFTDSDYDVALKAEIQKTYERIYLQLNQTDSKDNNHVDIKLATSLFASEMDLPSGNRDELNNFLSAIYSLILDENADLTSYNLEVEFEDTGEGVLRKVLNQTLAIPILGNKLNSSQIFELETALKFNRKTAFIHSDFTDVDSVRCAKTHFPPLLTSEKILADESTKQFSSLTDFAQKFEDSFTTENLKMAAGINKDEINTKSKTKDIWVVRLDSANFGFDLTDSKPIYYAMKPLSTTLRTGDVLMREYTSAEGLSTGTEVITFSEIDLDAWMLQFLEAVDLVLSPKYTTGAYIANEAKLEELVTAKGEIAGAFVNQLITVFEEHNSDGSGAALDEAREKLKQRLLVKLSDAYKVNTVVQFPVNKTSTKAAKTNPPLFYGTPTIDADNSDRDYAFSTDKANLDGSKSNLTFLFSSKHLEKEPFVNFDLGFQISHVEHDFKEAIDGYMGSSWLAFVLPEDVNLRKNLGEANIPVVLRAYPSAPSLVNQTAKQSLIETYQSQLKNATQWDYCVNYSQTAAGQDTIKSEIHLNIEPGFVPPQPMNLDLVFPALANFVSLYPQILADLTATLPSLTTTTADLTVAQNAVAAFADLVAEVCESLTTEHAVAGAMVVNNLETVTFNLEIQESEGANDMFNVRVEPLSIVPNSHSLFTPKIEIEDYKIIPVAVAGFGEKNYQYGEKDSNTVSLDWTNAKGIKERRLRLENLDILKYQNVISGIWLRRNEDLSDSIDENFTTNSEFIYTTPRVNFPNKLVPILDNRDAINIHKEVGTGLSERSLGSYLEAFFREFFDKGQGEDEQLVKLECSYGYRIQDNEDLPEIKLPILLAPPTIFNIYGNQTTVNDFDKNNPEGYVSKLAATIQKWFDDNQPSDENAKERFIFDISVFSKIEESRLPIVRLRNVFLNRDDVL